MLEAATTEPIEAGPSPAVPASATEHEIELALSPEQAGLLSHRPGLVRDAAPRPVTIVWYDDPEATLGQQQVVLEHQRGQWELQALAPSPACTWPASVPPPALGRAASQSELEPPPPFDTAPVAAFEGKYRLYRHGEVVVRLTTGALRGVLQSKPTCRLRLRGVAPALQATVAGLADLALSVPRASLAREALAVARGERVPARSLGAPSLRAGLPVSDGLALLLSHLLDALLHWVDQFRAAPTPEAVHQARVATRRLRSVLTLYRSAAASPDREELAATLRLCAARLGAARDWDVFLAGTGARLAQGGADPRVGALLRAARRRRDAAYGELAAYLDGADFRRLELSLGLSAALRPWEQAPASPTLGEPSETFAAAVLHHRLKRVRSRGRRLQELPTVELHELRKDCKKLRYAIEFFSDLFPRVNTRPTLKRLTLLQDELGLLNDAASVAGLMGQLGRAGRGYAGGLVEGWAAAEAVPARSRVTEGWRKFKDIEPFWR